jgi:two-component system sensor histidine kinase PilS (NtrC family)
MARIRERRVSPQTPEDWRILRALSLYRLLLDILLLVLMETGIGTDLFGQIAPRWFHLTCIVYAIAALLLLLPVLYRTPRIAIQAHLHCAVDVVAIISLIYASGGISSGLGVLLITPIVGCGLVLERRMALAQPAVAIAALFAEEVIRASPHYSTSDLTGTALLGLILFGSTFTANTVAQRARRSEELAARVGSEFENLSALNERIIENLQTGVLVVDHRDRARLLNDAVRRQLGVRRDDAIVQLSPVFPALAKALHEWRENPHRELSPVLPRAGAPELLPRIMRLGRDIDSSILVLLDETARLREQAQHMKLAALGRMSASIAHEIRNPLSAINHAGQLLAESDRLADADRRLLEIVERHTARIDRIINDVLSLSRRDEAVPATLELGSWLLRAVEVYVEGHPARRKQFDSGRLQPALYVRFDPNHLQQILFNLWDNSFQHGGRPESEIHITLRIGTIGGRQHPFLEIADDGPGIPPDLREHMFEPFFTTAHQGSGLGLYLARELCEYNQARLEYLERDSGACFRLIFVGAEQQLGDSRGLSGNG